MSIIEESMNYYGLYHKACSLNNIIPIITLKDPGIILVEKCIEHLSMELNLSDFEIFNTYLPGLEIQLKRQEKINKIIKNDNNI
jgi:hypothetical protein